MLVIRFFRIGKRNQPSFKVVVTEKKNPPRAGRFVEQVGFYNPETKETILQKDRIQYWISKGAQPSPTAYNLFIKNGIIEGKKIAVHKKSKKAAVAPAPAVATPVAPTAPVAPAQAPVAAPVEPTPVAPAPAAEVPVAEPQKEAPKEGPVA
jgi:small subunit ribosomal protein S16